MVSKSPKKVSDGAADEDQAKRAKIYKINSDATLTADEKTRLIQQILGGGRCIPQPISLQESLDPLAKLPEDVRKSITCPICSELVKRPITLACQHNICLDCLRMNITHGHPCPLCRKAIDKSLVYNPRINMSVVDYIRRIVAQARGRQVAVAAKVHREEREPDEERPEEAFVTSRAVRKGLANACSGSLKMTCPQDHFGPIGPEFDPRRKRGLVVGDMFPNRMACRMWNAHLPHVAGIAGQSNRGAQSVVLSGGYEDDVDEGEYFLYTGSGGKDLSGNKRNGAHDKDQEFTRYNMALKKSCEEGLPVRVIRSHKEKRSAYAPKLSALDELQDLQLGGGAAGRKAAAAADDTDNDKEADDEDEGDVGMESEDGEGEEEVDGEGKYVNKLAQAIANNPVRYDGIYRVLQCWRSRGKANYLVCRYLFVRCDNTPAPWSTEDCGDKPHLEIPERAAREIAEARKLKEEVTEMTKNPAWDYDPVLEEWGWARPPPAPVTKAASTGSKAGKSIEKQLESLRRELKRMTKDLATSSGCALCQQVTMRPVYTPCAHVYCLECLKGKVDGKDAPARHNARPPRSSTHRKACPARGCGKDLTAFMRDVQVNHAMATQATSAAEAVQRKEAEVAEMQRRVDSGDATIAEEDEVAKEAVAEASPWSQKQEGVELPVQVETEAKVPREEAAQAPTAPLSPAKCEAAEQSGEAKGSPAPLTVLEKVEGEAADVGDVMSRWHADAVCLAVKHPGFDVALLEGLLEDQGGDVAEVDAYIKRIKRATQRGTPGKSSPKGEAGAAAGAGGSKNRGGRKRSGSWDSRGEAADEEQHLEADDEAVGVEEEDNPIEVDVKTGKQKGKGKEEEGVVIDKEMEKSKGRASAEGASKRAKDSMAKQVEGKAVAERATAGSKRRKVV